MGAYTHQVEVRGERLLMVSGQIGMTRDGAVAEEASAQLEQALDNVRLNLEAAGMAMGDLVKLTIFLTEEIPGAERQRIIHDAVGEDPPAATLVYVWGLAAPHLKAEVEAIATAP